jgi:hypothetical protein
MDHLVYIFLDLSKAINVKLFARDLLAARDEITELALYPACIGQVLRTTDC